MNIEIRVIGEDGAVLQRSVTHPASACAWKAKFGNEIVDGPTGIRLHGWRFVPDYTFGRKAMEKPPAKTMTFQYFTPLCKCKPPVIVLSGGNPQCTQCGMLWYVKQFVVSEKMMETWKAEQVLKKLGEQDL